ncbi:hypothetical protein [Paenibacillus eucommiae]|uniref:Uncharacterized protein n=1 Tax=Paenibacillus eucommiae TaxID=1355755 RepID=A0ABS4IM57_9BACL|nr:hypothetical protein [Paenibacillus eucommiae]MBP1988657.1 hypothetical protein [Paenibacillus eucommiae]
MAQNRRLETDEDLQEVLDSQAKVRVFLDGHIVDSGGTIVRYTEEVVVIQTTVSQFAYHQRDTCEFFEMKKR